jgi:hypothetical protein
MSRVAILSLFLLRDLYRSLLGVAPPALALALYWITFYYPVNAGYFAAVGGADLFIVCLVTTLLVASRCNRATSYPLIARLQRRWELLGAIVWCSLGVTAALGIAFGLLAVTSQRVTLTPAEVSSIIPRWLAAFALAAAIGLNISRLVSRRGSHLVTLALLGLLTTTGGSQLGLGQEWAAPRDLARTLMGPLGQVMSGESAALDPSAVAWTVLYALILFLGAALLFKGKDLLWAE